MLDATQYLNYSWTNGDTTASTWATMDGTYAVTISHDSATCVHHDSIVIEILDQLPLADVGACDGDTPTLDAGTMYGMDHW
jgi:hypothetical protein